VAAPLPYLSAELPGTGGALRVSDEDFAVEEIPAYLPAGDGPHVFAWIEKRGVNTMQAVRELARAVGAAERDVGSAGLKDRHAVTRQWLSFPPPVTPEALLATEVRGVRVLSASRHGNKLRTGHLRGNRFTIVVRGVDGAADQAAARAGAVLALLAQAPGSPNWYGEQRFGAAGDNAAVGRALLDGGGGRCGQRERRLMVSAYQSELFNRYLARRLADGAYRRVLGGDLCALVTGATFASSDPEVDQARLEAGEIVPTGPMFGHSMRQPVAGSEAAEREAALLAEEAITLESFRRLGQLAPGARRPIAVRLDGAAVRPVAADAISIEFALPSGAYATAVLRELMKTGEA
jgi:tRNA pseudouridine13 synthase